MEAEHGADAVMEANRHRFQGNQVSPQELLGACQAIPFLDPLRLIVVDGLLAIAESRSGGGRGRRGSNNAADAWQALGEAIPGMPDTTLLLLSDGALNASNPLLRTLRQVCNVEELEAPRGEQLARWIKETAESKGGRHRPGRHSVHVRPGWQRPLDTGPGTGKAVAVYATLEGRSASRTFG